MQAGISSVKPSLIESSDNHECSTLWGQISV